MFTTADTIIMVAIAIIFIVLITLINKVNAISGTAAKPAAPAPQSAPKSAAPVAYTGIALETVAAISAAVAACMGESAPGVPYKIAAITRKPTLGTRPSWGFAGMRQNTEPF